MARIESQILFMKKEKISLFKTFSKSCINRKEAKEQLHNHKKHKARVTSYNSRTESEDEEDNDDESNSQESLLDKIIEIKTSINESVKHKEDTSKCLKAAEQAKNSLIEKKYFLTKNSIPDSFV